MQNHEFVLLKLHWGEELLEDVRPDQREATTCVAKGKLNWKKNHVKNRMKTSEEHFCFYALFYLTKLQSLF